MRYKITLYPIPQKWLIYTSAVIDQTNNDKYFINYIGLYGYMFIYIYDACMVK